MFGSDTGSYGIIVHLFLRIKLYYSCLIFNSYNQKNTRFSELFLIYYYGIFLECFKLKKNYGYFLENFIIFNMIFWKGDVTHSLKFCLFQDIYPTSS